MSKAVIENIPQHVAIILDGNRRWARKKKLPIIAGHRKVANERIEELIERAAELKIPYITFWAFSTENWGRAEREIKAIMRLFRWALEKKANVLTERGARLNMIGDMSKFPKDIQNGFAKMMRRSEENELITVTFALNYGGRDEIVRAINRWLDESRSTNHEARKIDEESFSELIDTGDMPDPDLIIRSGGEQRLSGFMAWQSVYSELYFTEVLMPDFGKEEFDQALEEYGKRQRRFGKG